MLLNTEHHLGTFALSTNSNKGDILKSDLIKVTNANKGDILRSDLFAGRLFVYGRPSGSAGSAFCFPYNSVTVRQILFKFGSFRQ